MTPTGLLTSGQRPPNRRRGSVLRRLLVGYLVAVGILAHAAAAIGVVWVSVHYGIAPARLADEALDRLHLRDVALFAPKPMYQDVPLDGQIRPRHPRILLPDLADWDGRSLAPMMAKRARLFAEQGIQLKQYGACNSKDLVGKAACWVTSGDVRAGADGVALLASFALEPPAEVGQYGNIWSLALAYDLLSLHPDCTQAIREQVEARLAAALSGYLRLLDGNAASLWHGRSSLAAQAWLAAVVLDPANPVHKDLVRRAQAHFRETLRAMALTEAWPEGYNYWINSRAFLLTLAAAAWLNGVDGSEAEPAVRTTLRRIGLWTIYTTRPDNRVVALADEGPRVDLKDETRRIIDLIAQLTREPVFATYSRYLEALHGRESYYRGYRWSFGLLNDPTVKPLPGLAPGSLTGLEHWLPRADLFGAGAMNLLVARTGWGQDDTLVTLRAGHSFTHHGHYDAGHFTVFKGAPLAISNSSYGGNITAPHRLYYGIRTIAKNSIVVLRPNERVKPNRFFSTNVVDGGQRIVMPTGSAIVSLANWRANLNAGGHFEGANVTRFDTGADPLVFLEADLTPAYDNPDFDTQRKGGKVSRVMRQALVMLDEDRLALHDHVVSTDPSFRKKWLLHTANKPTLSDALVVAGTSEAGILHSRADAVTIANGSGRLDLKRILPDGAVIRLVGGVGYEYYVESDGDDSDFDGVNFSEGAKRAAWEDVGRWRVEIQPLRDRSEDHFLVVLSPSINRDRSLEVDAIQVGSQQLNPAFATARSIVLFTTGEDRGTLRVVVPGEQDRIILVGVGRGDTIRWNIDGIIATRVVTSNGLVQLDIPRGHRGSTVGIER